MTVRPLCLLLEDGIGAGDVLVRIEEESGAELLLSLLVVGCAEVVVVVICVDSGFDTGFDFELVSFLLVAGACEVEAVLVRVDDSGAELRLDFKVLDCGNIEVIVVRVDSDTRVELLPLLLVTPT